MRQAVLLFALFGALLISIAVHATETEKPNFVVILADDLGYSDLGCYGGEISTPNLDSLGAGGLRYTRFHNCARCIPTRAALLTGYYPQQVRLDDFPGARSRRGPRQPWARLLPDYLRNVGYRSYHSGKWHLGKEQPLESGFDRSYSLDDHNRNFAPQQHSLDGQSLPPVKHDANYYTTTAIADYAISFLEQHAEEHSEKPFFVYIAFTVPHFPLQAPARDIAKYKNQYQQGWDKIRQSRWKSIREKLSLTGQLSELEPRVGPPYFYDGTEQALGPNEVWNEKPWSDLEVAQKKFQAEKMRAHAAMVDRMDQEIGRVVAQLREMGGLENTVIFFLSDNGASAELMVRGDGHDPTASVGSAESFVCLGPGWSRAANTPFRRHKTWVHEGGTATPLIVHWPKGITDRGGIRSSAVGHAIDIAPTIMELAGAERSDDPSAPKPPGVSLVRTFKEDVQIDRPMLWWLHEGNRAIWIDNWKLVAARDQAWELFDSESDPTESNDLAAANQDRVQEMEKVWDSAAEQFHKDRQESTISGLKHP